jgi:uncharacterized protein YcbK (DUF882 family)
MSLLAAPGQDDLLLPSRRHFLQASAAAVASLSVPALAQTSDFWSLPRELWLYRPQTSEQVRAVYWADGQIVVDGYSTLCQILRDAQRNLAVQFDLVTLDIARGLYGWNAAYGYRRPLIVNSGDRHPLTNAKEGGARNSFHIRAQASTSGSRASVPNPWQSLACICLATGLDSIQASTSRTWTGAGCASGADSGYPHFR